MASNKQRSKKKKPLKKKSSKGMKAPKNAIPLRKLLPYLAVVIAFTTVAMWPVVNADFTEIDDQKLIIENTDRYERAPRSMWTQSLYTPHFKPVTLLSWMFEKKVFGLNSRVVHVNNLLLHILNAVLAFFLVYRFSGRFMQTKKRPEVAAVVSGVFFGVHPLHVESVAWAIERKDVLYTAFFLLGLLAYIRYIKTPSWKWMTVVVALFLLSVMSKSSAIIFPFILFLLDYTYDRKWDRKVILEKLPVIVVFVLALFLFGAFGNEPSGGGAGSREGNIANIVSNTKVSDVYPLSEFGGLYAKVALMGLKGVFWYAHTYLPVGQSLSYPYKQWLPSIGHLIHIFPIILLGAIALLWRFRRSRKLLFFTHAFFFIALGPALIRTGLGKSIFLSDRYTYLALLGIMFFVAAGLHYLMERRKLNLQVQYTVFGTIALVLTALCFNYARKWNNGETLWSNTIEKYPGIAYAYVNRAMYYKNAGRMEEAMADFNSALELEDDEHALVNRGTMLRDQGQYNAAIADFERLLRISPNNEYALNGLANVYFTMGRYQDAIPVYNKGIELYPNSVNFYTNRGATYFYLGQHQQALRDFNEAQRRAPYYPGINSKKTVVYMAMGDWQNAIRTGTLTAQEEPNNHANFGDLGRAYTQTGQFQKAVNAYTRAINLNPNGKRYYRGRAKAYDALGNIQAAQNDRQKAQSL